MFTTDDFKRVLQNFVATFNSQNTTKLTDDILIRRSDEAHLFAAIYDAKPVRDLTTVELNAINTAIRNAFSWSIYYKKTMRDYSTWWFYLELAIEINFKTHGAEAAHKTRKRLLFPKQHYSPFSIYDAYIGSPSKPENQFYFYRGDSRHPEIVFDTGFKTRLWSNKSGFSFFKDTLENVYNFAWTKGCPAILDHSYSRHSIAFARLPHEAAAFPISSYSKLPDVFFDLAVTRNERKPLFKDKTWVYEVFVPENKIVDTHAIELLTTNQDAKQLAESWLQEGAYVKEIILRDTELPQQYIRRAFQVERVCELIRMPGCCSDIYIPCLRQFRILAVADNPRFGQDLVDRKSVEVPCPWFQPSTVKEFISTYGLIAAELNGKSLPGYSIPQPIFDYSKSLLTDLPRIINILECVKDKPAANDGPQLNRSIAPVVKR